MTQINLRSMFLDSGRKPEHVVREPANSTKKGPQLGFEPKAKVLTTT